jgi:glycosyltransferase involved in cell wall biosynthesis
MKHVSVIIPVYGVEKYIAATVQSILNQTYQNFELIIVDDGSPDRSLEICQQFLDSRIKIISQENRGPSGARNTGISHATGEYIAFLDGDDMWLPEKLEKHLNHLESNPNIGVSFSCSAFIDEAGNPLGTYQVPQLSGATPQNILRCNPLGNGSAFMVRRQVLEAIKFQDNLRGTTEYFYFDESLRRSEDVEFLLRIAIKTDWQIEGLSEALTLYRVNSSGLSANLLKQLYSWKKMMTKIRCYAPDLIAKIEDEARAYELRYLARSAVRRKIGSMAVKLMNKAIASHWKIILEEPRRTLLTWVAAYLVWLLPQSVYSQVESLGSKVTGAMQKRRILQEESAS